MGLEILSLEVPGPLNPVAGSGADDGHSGGSCLLRNRGSDDRVSWPVGRGLSDGHLLVPLLRVFVGAGRITGDDRCWCV